MLKYRFQNQMPEVNIKNPLHLCNSIYNNRLAKEKRTPKKRKRSKPGLFIILFSFLFCTLLIYQFFKNQATHFVRYDEFGIDIPVNYSIHGIDVSHHNEDIDWKEVKNMNIRGIHISFVFIKATEGVSYKDSQFDRNWLQSKKAGITRGAYHYFSEGITGKEQAAYFIKTVGPLEPGDLAPVLDIEENNLVPVNILQQEALVWLDLVEKHYGIRPIVYSFVNFYETKLGSAFDGYPFWAAHYKEKYQPRTNRSWQIWQHNENGHVNGISEKVDFNVFKGDLYDFRKLLVP
jgi:lysozyme